MARVLLTLRHGAPDDVQEALSKARVAIGAPITAAGPREYRRSYDNILTLHQLHELEMIHDVVRRMPLNGSTSSQQRRLTMNTLKTRLDARLNLTQPSLRAREPILGLRRAVYDI